jgi:hypothetical protein
MSEYQHNLVRHPAPVLIMAVAVFLLSLAARAATVTGYSDIMSRLKVSTASNHEIKFVTPTGVQTSTDTITVTFQSDFSLSAIGFDDVDFAVDTDGTPGDCAGTFTEKTIAAAAGSSPTWGASVSGQVLTLTPPTDAASGEIAAASCVRLRIGTNATVGSAGNSQIVNPSTAVNHTIIVGGGFGDSGTAFAFINDDDQVTVTAAVGGGGGGGPPPPPNPPVIFNVRTQSVTETTADVLWDTDIASTSFVDYGTTVSYGSTASVGGTTFNHSVPLSGLTAGTLYHFRVRSTGTGTPEATSGDFTFTTLDTTPPVLSNIQAVDVTGTGARITWDTNEDADSRVDYGISEPYSNFVFNATLTNAHSMTLTGLTPSTIYRYRVTSRDASSNSSTSVEFTFQTLDTVPPTISNISVDNITQTSARVNWSTNELADSRVDYGTAVAYGSVATNATLVANHQITLNGLAAGTLYHFTVNSKDAAGNSSTSTDQTFTTATDTSPPANVTGLTATPGDRQIALAWTNPPDPDFAGVRIRRGTVTFPATPTSGTQVYDGAGTSFLDTGLTNGVTYYYTAFAYDGSGNFASGALVSAVPADGIPPGPVTNLTVTPGNQQNQLTWTNPTDPDFLQVRIQRSTTGFPATPTSGTTVYEASSPSYLDTGLTNGTTYYYSVFAQDTSLNYSAPAQVSGTPSAPPAVCGNAVCEATESTASCPADCPAVPACGDGTCQPPENSSSCPADCPTAPPVCGDAVCQPPENSSSCPADCPVTAVCGNTVCEPPETPTSCPADCVAPPPEGPVCGNGPCEPGETNATCATDCHLAPVEPQPAIEIPETTIEPEEAMDLTKVKYYTHGRTLEVVPDEFGFIYVLPDVIFSVMIPVDAFRKPVEKIYLNFGRSSYLFGKTDDGQSWVVDIVVSPSAVTGGQRSGDARWRITVHELFGVRTARAAETLFSISTALIIYYQDGSVEVATPTLSVQDYGRVFEKIDGERVGVQGAGVTLFQKVDGNWVVWNGTPYNQVNPALTRAGGTFGFMVKPGEYRIEVVKDGYRKVSMPPFTVTSSVVNINADIELVKIPPAITEVIIPGAPVTENIANVAKAIGAQTVYVAKVVQTEIIENPQVKQTTTQIVVPAAAIVTATVVVTAVQATSLVSYIYFIITQPVLLLGRRKRKEFGTVYNSLTKMPVDLAILRLYRIATNKLVRTLVTDKQGRYAFLVEPGEYRIEVAKPGFKFPTEHLREKKEDVQYTEIYHGETIKVGQAGAVITANIPMDPLELIKSNRRLVLEEIGRRIQNLLAPSSVVLTLIALVLYRQAYLLVAAVVQVLLYLLFRRLARPKQPKNWGIIYNEGTKKPVPFAIARIVETQYNKVLESRVTDSKGRYNFLVGNNKYYVSVEKPGFESARTDELDLTKAEKGGGVVGVDIPIKEKKQ